ncbi:MAG TPA: type II toxin-antitoxin system VapC family toxin [Bryobacteraceae bacterium]|jgi:predicted nucleic acid-binding protein
MPAFVADASVTLSWCFEEERTPATEALLDRLRSGESAIVPTHWPVEVMNGLITAMRRERIAPETVVRFVRDLTSLHIRVEQCPLSPEWNALMQLATKHRLTAYDAAYLELAVRNKFRLATLDNDLRKAARAEGVALVEM